KPGVFKSYDELLDYLGEYTALKKSYETLINSYETKFSAPLGFRGESEGLGATATFATGYTEGEKRYSETNIQVIGVDEPDPVKTNGRVLVVRYRYGYDVVVIDVEKDVVASRIYVDGSVKGLFLKNNTLVIITGSPEFYRIYLNQYYQTPSINTTILLYDLSNPYDPRPIGNISVSGIFSGARFVNNTVYLITKIDIIEPIIPCINNRFIPLNQILLLTNKPEYYIVITALNIESMNYTSYAFIMSPTSWIYMSLHRLYLASLDTYYYLDVRLIVLKIMSKYLPQDIQEKIQKYIDRYDPYRAYREVEDYLKEISDEEYWNIVDNVRNELENYTFTEKTIFYVFRTYYTNITYLGSFAIEGRVLDQFSMEEMGNYFVVATTSNTYRIVVEIYRMKYDTHTSWNPSNDIVTVINCKGSTCYTTTIPIENIRKDKYVKPRVWINTYYERLGASINNVYVVDWRTMNITGSLHGLAPGERIYSSRLIGKIFYLVTFRTVDPLFAINLTDPSNPEVIGFIESPGFSDYLHPLPDNLLLGIGREDNHLKISLYNISNPTRITEISKIKIEDAWSTALHDHHAVTIDYELKRIYIPIIHWGYSTVSTAVIVVSYENNTLSILEALENEDAYRTVYIGDKIYVVGDEQVVVYDMYTFDYITSIDLGE
ncbi:MAG: hypothetical protein B6U89_05625, partial [Desulfurococcales archaeon ex4484_58]